MVPVTVNGERSDQAGFAVNDGAVLALTHCQLEDVVGGLRLEIGENIFTDRLNQAP